MEKLYYRLAVTIIVVLNLVALTFSIEYWPLSTYPMYSIHLPLQGAESFFVDIQEQKTGKVTPLSIRPLYFYSSFIMSVANLRDENEVGEPRTAYITNYVRGVLAIQGRTLAEGDKIIVRRMYLADRTGTDCVIQLLDQKSCIKEQVIYEN